MEIESRLFLLVFVMLSIIPVSMIPNSQTNAAIKSYPQLHSLNDIYFPPAAHNISPLKIGDQINPYAYYSSEPAPMGIADYGISPNGPFIRNTSEWYGIVVINGLNAISNGTPWVSFQLNVVLNYQYNGYTYALWVQDVADYNTANNEICFVDNIWNMTSPNASVVGVQGDGGIYTTNSGVSYYAYIAPGFTTLSLPATIQLFVSVSTNSNGQPVIYFWYNDGNRWVNYDVATVTNVFNANNVYFLVNGYTTTGDGHLYDAELVMGGPGGGLCAYIYNASVFFRLYYWNGHNYQEVRNAYNFGSDTAETVNNVDVLTYYYSLYGLYTSGLTSGSGSLSRLWSQDTTTQLTIYTNTYNGYVYVYNESDPYSTAIQYENSIPLSEVSFTGGQVTLTLNPMNYAILVYNQNGQLVGEANIHTYSGENAVTSTTQFSVSVSNPTLAIAVHSTSTVNININAYGTVTINVIGPSSGISYSLSQTQFYVDGSGTATLTINGINTGTYTLIVNATLFPGYYITQAITVNVITLTAPFTLTYTVNGQSLPQSPEVTFSFPNGTVITIPFTSGFTIQVPTGTTYTVQQIIGGNSNVRWATENQVSGIINKPTKISVTYYEQFLITFNYQVINGQWSYSEPSVTYYYFGTPTTASVPTTVWADYNSPYQFSQMITSNSERIIATNYQGTIIFPGSITTNYYIQYYVSVNSPIPIYALINGKNISLTSNWYNGSITINVENITYYPSQLTRDVIIGISPSSTIDLTSPITIVINTITQYYLNISSPMPIYAIINGKNTTLTNNWYNIGTQIKVENITYYPSLHERYIMKSIAPAVQFTINSPINVKVNAIKQYFITVNSIIPVKAYINGSLTYLNSSWINQYTNIGILNYTYYVNSQQRYVILNISPQSFVVKSQVNVNVSTVKQYLVTINNVSTWYNEGSKVLLSANVPIYDVGEFVGTYNVSPGTYITVNSPIDERLVLSPNYVFYGGVSGLITAVLIAVVLLLTRKGKRK
ncbi:thermopsin family protease [Saccharolobus shibatae]|uniref:Putative membrane-anchored protein n=1 Tax=Saccharolobus shibatae TaxID=2286 RepID=A0A8F5C0Y8_9CREN|nr:thermopsin family protease [Saccharolobus shibatae]QXJ35052.1 putative membrane-anchored protein [Saccharolobus shibatae]